MINRLYGWYGKRVVRIVFGIILVLVLVGFYIGSSGTEQTVEEVREKPQVVVGSVSSFQNLSNFSVIGTVRAVSQANLETEAGGRITDVSVEVGDAVSAGTILARIENRQEAAQLLQAEGAYESALASSFQSGTSLEEVRTRVRNAYRDTFSTADAAVNTIDQFFTKTPGLRAYGLRLTGVGKPSHEIVNDRMALEVLLETWASHLASDFEGLTEAEMFQHAESTLIGLSNLTSVLIVSVDDSKNEYRYTDAEKVANIAALNGARQSLDGALSDISGSRSAYEQAQIASTGGAVSQSDAALKSALGALRGAQANYEKTIIRTPISGIVNALYLKEGEYTNPGQPAALVANNGSLEISTALSEEDLTSIKMGDMVRINNTGTGTITSIAPAVDPLSGKSEILISVDDARVLKNGSTASVRFMRTTEATPESSVISIPLAAVKLLPSGPVAFGVNDAGVLISLPVTIGSILGETVEIREGLTRESEIVFDVRGLNEGQAVTINKN